MVEKFPVKDSKNRKKIKDQRNVTQEGEDIHCHIHANFYEVFELRSEIVLRR